ncbi:CIC11C00000002045 [Sungouiella intermedia]|uniref:Dol-P-Glc:Glc(2)Man(9)GlcNAc(2)-PP-Dol alpha-1,2-glucosyltransferase n=1 Tax=Sungouiella intermedia TaxID=45354 RepID=A0A1L0CVE0_9ASCO|nr:CIC11C00000002045 [[Candida] intermedia]
MVDLQSLVLPIFLMMTATIAQNVRLHVPLPFIDEIFHLRQNAVYCAHRFTEWDNKITTPPGLYLLGTAYYHVLKVLGFSDPCGPTALRSLNLLGGSVVFPIVLSLVHTNNYWRVNVVSLPLFYTYLFLYYTDVWSTVLVVAAVLVVVKYPNGKGAILSNLIGFTSLWFRQTNIVWVAFASVILIDFRRQKTLSFFADIKLFVTQAFKDWLLLVPYAVNGVLFVVFVKYNGGITFGDKENHQVSFHLAQVFYCAAFMAFFTFPLWFSYKTIKIYSQFAFTYRYGFNSVITAVSYALIYYIIKNYTVVHPFLLADNRHYTFYIYRKILSRKHAEVLLVPAYHFCCWLVVFILKDSHKSVLSMKSTGIIAFVGAIAITLIPSPLFEPRYYIVPLVLFRIFIRPKSDTVTRNHLYEFLWYLFINAVVFIVFFSYEFTWLTEPGYQRIIW